MIRDNIRVMTVAVCLAAVTRPSGAAPQEAVGDNQAIEGLWTGSWGGGQRDGAVFQPVLAELLVKGSHIELAGFRNVGRLTGTAHLDAGAKRMRITPAGDGQKAIEYVYELKGDKLTLTDGDKFPISLQKLPITRDPLANARVELVEATGINDAGDLLVTEFTVLRAGRADATYYRPEIRSRSTKRATVFLVREAGLKTVTVEDARRQLREPAPVAVAYREDDRASPLQLHELWRNMGSPKPDSEAVGRTLSRILRPGTLVFILSARENVPRP